jgi:outer membrane protein TolC
MRLIISLILMMAIFQLAAERIVSLQEVIDSAMQNNDDLVSAEYEVKSSRWSTYSALSSFLPSASFSYSRIQLDPPPEFIDYMGNPSSLDDKQTTATLQIVQPIITGGKRLLAYFISKRLEEMAENQFGSTELETRNTAEIKYLTLVESHNLKNIAKDDLATIKNNLVIAQIKFDTGITSETDLLQMQSEVASKEAALIDAEMYYQLSAMDLANFCGFSDRILIPGENFYDNTLVSILENSDIRKVSPLLEELCLERNLTIKTLDQNVKLGKLNRTMALSDNLPNINLIYERSWDDDYDFDDKKDESSSFIISASLPLLPFVDTFCNYKKEHYQFKIAQRELSSAQKGLQLQVNSSILSLLSAVKKLKSSELALEYADRTFQQMEERYRHDLASATDLLSISLLKQSSQIAVLQDQINMIKHKSELKQLLNLNSDDELINILINS